MGFRKIHFALSAILLLATQSSFSAYSEGKCRLLLSVQKDGMPLFQSIQLTIYKVENNNKWPIYNSKRHTAVLPLQPGHYVASAIFKDQVVQQTIKLQSLQEQFVVLTMK